MTMFQSFMPTVARWVSSAWRSEYRVLVDNATGAPIGLVSPNANGPEGIWAPTPLSAAQIAAPSAAMIADLNAVYQLNAAPWTRYQSDGDILIPIGSGAVDGSTLPFGLRTVPPGTPRLTVGVDSYDIVASPFTVQNAAGVAVLGTLAVIGTAVSPISVLTPQMFGAQMDGVANDTAAFEALMRAAASGGRPIDLGSGTAKLTRQITVPADVSVSYGDCVLDFTSVSGVSFPDNTCLYVAGDAAVQINDLNANVAAGDVSFALTSASDVRVDDVLMTWNPTDYSFSGFRAYYRAGEMMEVSSVSGATIGLYAGLYASYTAAAVNVYRCSRKTSMFSGGRLAIRAPDDAVYAVRWENITRPTVSNVETTGAESGIAFDKCYGVRASALRTRQTVFNSGGSGSSNYGVIISHCQNVRMWGLDLCAYKHALTTGGGLDDPAIPNRDIDAEGTFSNLYEDNATIGAVSAHGNTEHYHISGQINGGMQFGGNHGRVSGRIFAWGTVRCAISCAEMLGFDFIASDVTISAPQSNPASDSRAIIDICGNNADIDANTIYGGTFRLNNIRVDAPAGTRLLDAGNYGYVGSERLVIDLCGMHIVAVSGTSATMLRTKTLSGTDSWYVLLDDMINETNSSMTFSAGTKVSHPYGLKVGNVITAATTIVLDNYPSDNITVGGNTQIDAMTLADGQVRTLRFTGTPQVTNSATLVVEGGTRTMVAFDVAVVRGYANGVVRMSWTTGYSA